MNGMIGLVPTNRASKPDPVPTTELPHFTSKAFTLRTVLWLRVQLSIKLVPSIIVTDRFLLMKFDNKREKKNQNPRRFRHSAFGSEGGGAATTLRSKRLPILTSGFLTMI